MSLSLSSTETVIHYERTPVGVCPGKDKADAELAAHLAAEYDRPASYRTMLACYFGNVTCERCKSYLKANKERRKPIQTTLELVKRR